MTMLDSRREALRFFLDHAGYSYDPATETPFQGRWRAARDLADAEQRLKRGPYFIDVSADWLPYDAEVPWDGPVWIVALYTFSDEGIDPVPVGAIGGVACEAGDPYLRVIAAELASEYIKEEEAR